MPIHLRDIRSDRIKTLGIDPKPSKLTTIHTCTIPASAEIHAGTARMMLQGDLIVRQLTSAGHLACHIMSCDDAGSGVTRLDAEKNVLDFQKTMRELGISFNSDIEYTSDHITGFIVIINRLLDSGKAYISNGVVFARTTLSRSYGTISKLLPEDRGRYLPKLRLGQEGRMDFVLWQPSSFGEPSWDAPFGSGRPGPHAACWVIGRSKLGRKIDLRLGCRDLAFPSHENEDALGRLISGDNEGGTKIWMLSGTHKPLGLRRLNGTSETVQDEDLKCAVSEFGGTAVRLALIQKNFTSDSRLLRSDIQMSANTLVGLQDTCDLLRGYGGGGSLEPTVGCEHVRAQLQMNNDCEFDASKIIGVLYRIRKHSAYAREHNGNTREWLELLLESASLLGIQIEHKPLFVTTKAFGDHDDYSINVVGGTEEKAARVSNLMLEATEARYKKDMATLIAKQQVAWEDAAKIQTMKNFAIVIVK